MQALGLGTAGGPGKTARPACAISLEAARLVYQDSAVTLSGTYHGGSGIAIALDR